MISKRPSLRPEKVKRMRQTATRFCCSRSPGWHGTLSHSQLNSDQQDGSKRCSPTLRFQGRYPGPPFRETTGSSKWNIPPGSCPLTEFQHGAKKMLTNWMSLIMKLFPWAHRGACHDKARMTWRPDLVRPCQPHFQSLMWGYVGSVRFLVWNRSTTDLGCSFILSRRTCDKALPLQCSPLSEQLLTTFCSLHFPRGQIDNRGPG